MFKSASRKESGPSKPALSVVTPPSAGASTLR